MNLVTRCAAAAQARLITVTRRAVATARRHWLILCLLVLGAGLRVAVQVAYWPALLYIDSVRYVFAESHWDPLGYLVLLWPLTRLGGLAATSAAQHVLGLAMATGIYAIAVRYGVKRWVGALAAVPVLFDAYQLQLEQNIMADTLFDALIVAALGILLWNGAALGGRPPRPPADAALRGHRSARGHPGPRRPRPPADADPGRQRLARGPGIWAVALAGLVLGVDATVREVGVILVVPAAAFVWLAARGWRRRLGHPALLCATFALPVIGYMAVNYAATGRMELAGQGTNLYGRAAAAADCAALRIPAMEAPLCPAPDEVKRFGVDGLIHNPSSPGLKFKAPPGTSSRALRGDFTRQVIGQQPFAVATAIADAVARSFTYPRSATQADTPIFRWQFQTTYPIFPPALPLTRDADIIRQFGGGEPTVVRPVAAALRAYQRGGGYTPGPLLALCGVIGLAGAAGADRLWRRRRRSASPSEQPSGASGEPPRPYPPGLRAACFLVVATGLVMLVGADIVEFSWRYQLPGLVTLPLAGALGFAAVTGRKRPAAASTAAPRSEVTAPDPVR